MADHGRLNALLGLAEAQGCRRVVLLSYFGDDSQPCGNCDLCAAPPELFDGTEVVRKALSAILRTDEYYGAGHIIDVLTGNETDKIRRQGHQNLPTFGVGRDIGRKIWQGIMRQMMGLDLVRPDRSRHGALRITSKAHPVLRGETPVQLRRDTLKTHTATPRAKALVADEDALLLSALKAKRHALAKAANVPAYIVFPDRTLIEMAQSRPETLDQMAGINGVGTKKLERYGQSFLEVITDDVPALHPSRRKLAGQTSGPLYDRLHEVQTALSRGPDGLEKPLSCSASLLSRVSVVKPRNLIELERILGQKRAERFGPAFLELIRDHDAGL